MWRRRYDRFPISAFVTLLGFSVLLWYLGCRGRGRLRRQGLRLRWRRCCGLCTLILVLLFRRQCSGQRRRCFRRSNSGLWSFLNARNRRCCGCRRCQGRPFFIRFSASLFRLLNRDWRRWLNGSRCILCWCDDFDDGRWHGVCGLQFLALGIVERFAWLGCQLRLLRCQTGLGCRRRTVGDHRSFEYARRWLVALGGSTAYAFLRRGDGRSNHHRCFGNVFPRYTMLFPGDRF